MTENDIIERYLAAVAAQLPADQREDIVAELRDLILSMIEAKEDRLGRAATDAEKEEVLREIGHPLVVAARYRKGPDSLIGPELFPYWLFGVKAGLLLVAAAFVLSLGLDLLSGPDNFGQDIAQAFHGFFGAALTVIGMLTLIGAVMEHQNVRPRWLTNWRVSDLGAFNISDPSAWSAMMGQMGDATPRTAVPVAPVRKVKNWPGTEHLFSLLFCGLFVAWWVGLIHVPGMGHIEMRGEDGTITGAPIWAALFSPILAYGLAQGAVHLVGLMVPSARKLVALLEIAINAAGLWLTWTIWQAGHWFTLTRAGETARVESPGYLPSWNSLDRLREAGDRGLEVWAQNLSIIITWALLIGAVVLVWEIVRNLGRIMKAN